MDGPSWSAPPSQFPNLVLIVIGLILFGVGIILIPNETFGLVTGIICIILGLLVAGIGVSD